MDSLTVLADPAMWPALVTLIVMEVVLGIDVIWFFISILSNKLPEARKAEEARKVRIGARPCPAPCFAVHHRMVCWPYGPGD